MRLALRCTTLKEGKMRDFIAEAVRFAVIIEKKSYDIYRQAALEVVDLAGKRIFEKLARDESKHIDALLWQHPGTWCSDLRQKSETQPGVEWDLTGPTGNRVFEQLRLALLNKRWSIGFYTMLLRAFKEPRICRVFEMTLAVARKEFKLITDEYLQADACCGHSRSNRPPRRVHVREGIPASPPNKHSQLYFSMLDAGRVSRLG